MWNCSICYGNDNAYIITNCGHSYCINCLNKLKVCPKCKSDIDKIIKNYDLMNELEKDPEIKKLRKKKLKKSLSDNLYNECVKEKKTFNDEYLDEINEMTELNCELKIKYICNFKINDINKFVEIVDKCRKQDIESYYQEQHEYLIEFITGAEESIDNIFKDNMHMSKLLINYFKAITEYDEKGIDYSMFEYSNIIKDDYSYVINIGSYIVKACFKTGDYNLIESFLINDILPDDDTINYFKYKLYKYKKDYSLAEEGLQKIIDTNDFNNEDSDIEGIEIMNKIYDKDNLYKKIIDMYKFK
jgi:hypothetical protein